jgi:acyl dehydratase
MESPRFILYCDITEGMTVERDYIITPVVYQRFLDSFDDRSPIHVDADVAREAGFAGPVMHGAILNGFLSHFIGMVFPGGHSLLLSVELRFAKPSYLGDTLRLQVKVAQKVDAQQVILLHFNFFNQAQAATAATGRVQVKVSEK